MHKKILWITRTALMLALLICLQWVGSFVPEQMTKQLTNKKAMKRFGRGGMPFGF